MANKPNIRFKGFTEDWEQRKLEDYIVEYHEVTTENNQYPALTSSRKGIFLQTEYFAGNQIASEDNTGYNVVPYGYFTYRHRSDDEIFHFNINDIVENGIVSTLYPVFTTTNELDSRYLQYQLNHGREFARFAVLQKQGGSRTYMYLSKLKQLSLTMPKSVDEQKQISGFFMKLDHLITLHQRKCDDTKKLKKYMLQKMFPKNGEKKPEIRFAGFTDDWEQRKFGELFSRRMERNLGQFDNTRWISVAKMYFQDPDKVTSNNIDTRTYVMHEGDIAFEGHPNQEYRFGRFVANDIGDGVISELFPIYQHITPYDNNYWKYAIQLEAIMAPKLLRCIEISYTSSNKLDEKFFLEEYTMVPTIEEQQKIGAYFSTLDHLITLHQRKCDDLKKLKKYMLQNMFV